MFSSEQIIEQYVNLDSASRGDSVSHGLLPEGWSEQDANEIGLPSVLGSRDTGFVGVLLKDQTEYMPWASANAYPDFESAREDAVSHALKLKAAKPR